MWANHLRSGDPALVELLNAGRALVHPFVAGELACGNLENRAVVLSLLHDLPETAVATDGEVLFFLERRSLMGRGIRYKDAHLLAAVALAGDIRLWTRDRRLAAVPGEMALAHFPSRAWAAELSRLH